MSASSEGLAIAADTTDPIVAVRDVFVAFRGAADTVMALRGADLSVAAGERLLVQGPNGSGKSTLLRVITGEQPVLAGSVEVGGTPLHQLSATARRRWRSRTVGFIDQHAHRTLLPEHTALDNVALQLRLTGVSAGQARAAASVTLDSLGLVDLADREVPALSGGEAQLVAICAAVAHRPRLLLADEPTGELDEEVAMGVYAMLGQLASDGTSLIQVSHDPRAAQFADRTVAIRDGRLAEQWTEGARVEQVPDSRGWIRIPVQLLPSAVRLPGLVATPHPQGLLLEPGSIGPQTWPNRAEDPAMDVVEALDLRLPASTAPLRSAPVLEFSRVAAAFPGRSLFHDLDLNLRPGQLVVVTGPSGAGKSTLLALAAGLLDPSAGQVLVVGSDWAGRDRTGRAELRRRTVALSPQRPALLEPMTVRENLTLTAALRDQALDEKQLTQLVARLGLTALLDRCVDRLSGGERQRTALARCLASGAPLLLVDEPTSQQDEASAERVAHMLRAQAQSGRTILVATHDPRLIESADHRVRLGSSGETEVGVVQSTSPGR